MKRIKTFLIIFLIIGSFFSMSSVIYGKEYFYDVDFYEKEITNYIWKEYDGYYGCNEISSFYEEGSFGNYQKYAFVDSATPYPKEEKNSIAKSLFLKNTKVE